MRNNKSFIIKIDIRVLIFFIFITVASILSLLCFIKLSFDNTPTDQIAVQIAGKYRGNGTIDNSVNLHKIGGYSQDEYIELRVDKTCYTNIIFMSNMTGACTWAKNTEITASDGISLCMTFPGVPYLNDPLRKNQICFEYDANHIIILGGYLEKEM